MFTEMLIKTLNNEDHLGVVTFGTTAKVAFPVKRMGPDVKVRSRSLDTEYFYAF